MSAPPPLVPQASVPAPTNPVGAIAAVDQSRDLVAEKQTEQKQDRAEVAAKAPMFQARKVTSLSRPIPAAPEYETLIFKAAVNNPFADLADFSASLYIPNFATAFYLLNFMDHTMASTKRWTDNCMGWVPPISQMFISVLMYVQVFRALDAASALRPGSPEANFLQTFINVFPLNELWIPGPLVALFRSISAFWPSADDQFGNVTPAVPDVPGWTAANAFNLANHRTQVIQHYLPNISFYISRLRSVTTVATEPAMTQSAFTAHVNGPNNISELFRTAVTNSNAQSLSVISPGAAFAYPDNLQLWINAASHLNRLSIPSDLTQSGTGATVPINEWSAYLRFSQTANEHTWFGPVAAVMAKYCQFFNGSSNMDSIVPNCSAAAAVKLTATSQSTMYTRPTFSAAQGNGGSNESGNQNSRAHYQLRNSARLVLNGRIALKGIPDAHVYSAMTFAVNSYEDGTAAAQLRTGNFWSLGPDVQGRDNIEVLPGVLSTIVREYHSDTRITATKQ